MTDQERADRFEAQSFLELYRKAARRLRSPRGLMVARTDSARTVSTDGRKRRPRHKETVVSTSTVRRLVLNGATVAGFMGAIAAYGILVHHIPATPVLITAAVLGTVLMAIGEVGARPEVPSRTPIVDSVAHLAAQGTDFASTALFVTLGAGSEGNPVADLLLKGFGLWGLFALKLAGSLLLCRLAWRHGAVLRAATALFAAVAIWNIVNVIWSVA